jgi:hypothetical protein
VGKRGVPCSVCAHKARHQIEVGLTHGVPHRVLGNRFGLSHDAIGRHAQNHLSPQMRAAILTAQKPTAIDLEALQASESEGLLSQLVSQRARLQQHSELAASLGDVRGCVAAESAITSNLALVGRLLGMIVQRHDVRSTSILISADYLALRQAIVQALRPYPQAAAAVGAALARLETAAADSIHAAAGKPVTAPERLIEQEPVDVTPDVTNNPGTLGVDIVLPPPPAPLGLPPC